MEQIQESWAIMIINIIYFPRIYFTDIEMKQKDHFEYFFHLEKSLFIEIWV